MEREDRILLADLFSQLSEFFKEPTRGFAEDVASGMLFGFFRKSLAESGIDQSLLRGLLLQGNVYATLMEEYRRLFLGPLPPYITPVESVYKRWTDDPECKLPIANEKGYLMGDPAIDMITRYQANGIVIPDKYSSMPDHIALELEYMAFLCDNASEKEQKEFLRSHLDWIVELADDIKHVAAEGGFYCTAAEVASRIIYGML